MAVRQNGKNHENARDQAWQKRKELFIVALILYGTPVLCGILFILYALLLAAFFHQ